MDESVKLQLSLQQFVLPAIDVKAIRLNTGLTQQAFADTYGFSLSNVTGWEAGRKKPRGSARIVLKMIERDPTFIHRVLGLPQKGEKMKYIIYWKHGKYTVIEGKNEVDAARNAGIQSGALAAADFYAPYTDEQGPTYNWDPEQKKWTPKKPIIDPEALAEFNASRTEDA